MNDEARMTKVEGMSGMTKPRMIKLEGMTNSENARDDEMFWNEDAASFVRDEASAKRVYDLEMRTARFGEAVIDFAKTVPRDPVTNGLISQLVGAGTSVGANYVEADDAVAKKEFLNNIGTGRMEARETKHFLRTVARAVQQLKSDARKLWMEARELHLFFSKIWRSRRNEQ